LRAGPTTPYSTVEHGKFAYVGYTGVFNVLDYPAASFPCGVVTDKEVDSAYVEHTPLSDIDAQIQGDCMCPNPLSFNHGFRAVKEIKC
jgi:amidase